MQRRFFPLPSFALLLGLVGCGNPHLANEGSIRLLDAMTAAQQAQLGQEQSFGLDVRPLFSKIKSLEKSQSDQEEIVLEAKNINSANEKLILTNLSQDQLQLDIGLEKGEVFSSEFNGKQVKDLPSPCEETLSAGKSCLLDINFSSSKVGHFQDNLTIHFRGTLLKEKHGEKKLALKADRLSDQDKDSVNSDLSLKAWVPHGLFERRSYVDFGSLKIKQEKRMKLRLKNNGKLDALISSDFKLGKNFQFSGSSFPGAEGTCKDVLKAHQGCWIELEFTGENAGLFSDDLIISYEDENKTKQVSLTVNLLGERINQ